MKGFLAGCLGALVLLGATTANAGDKWTGFYIGAQGGFAKGDGDQTIITDGTGFLTPTGPVKIDGQFGGLHIGYDYQFSNFVLGLNAEYNWGSIDGVFDNAPPALNDLYFSTVNRFGSVRARAGFVVPGVPQLLVYGTGGIAFANIKGANGDGNNTTPIALNCANNCGKGSTSETGYTAGGGLAWALPGTALVLSAEYSFYDFGKARISTTSFNGGNPHVFDVDTSFRTGRIGLSYKFN